MTAHLTRNMECTVWSQPALPTDEVDRRIAARASSEIYDKAIRAYLARHHAVPMSSSSGDFHPDEIDAVAAPARCGA